MPVVANAESVILTLDLGKEELAELLEWCDLFRSTGSDEMTFASAKWRAAGAKNVETANRLEPAIQQSYSIGKPVLVTLSPENVGRLLGWCDVWYDRGADLIVDDSDEPDFSAERGRKAQALAKKVRQQVAYCVGDSAATAWHDAAEKESQEIINELMVKVH